MKKGENKSEPGFTIIEVALVLAIAGLIFMMVFVALPSLRRQQRDTQRREDVATFIQAIKKYQTNNRGALPTDTGEFSYAKSKESDTSSWWGFYANFLGDNFIDPTGGPYKLKVQACGNMQAGNACDSLISGDIAFPNDYEMMVYTQATCSGEQAVKSSNPRKVAVLYRLEGAGVYCGNT